MTTNYRYPAPRFIMAEHLGHASAEQAQRMCAMMQAKGWDVRYGDSPNRLAVDASGRELEFPVEAFEADWNDALDVLSQEVAPLNAELQALRESLDPVTRAAVQTVIESLMEDGNIKRWNAAAALVRLASWHGEGVLDSALIDARAEWPNDPVDVLAARIVLQEYERQAAAAPVSR